MCGGFGSVGLTVIDAGAWLAFSILSMGFDRWTTGGESRFGCRHSVCLPFSVA